MSGTKGRREVLEGAPGKGTASGDGGGTTHWPMGIVLSQVFLGILALIVAPFTMSPTDLALAVAFGYGAVLGLACYAWFSRKLVGRLFAGRNTPRLVLSPAAARRLAVLMGVSVVFGQASLAWSVLCRLDSHRVASTGELVAKSRDRVRSGICLLAPAGKRATTPNFC